VPIDPEILRKLSTRRGPERQGVESVVRGIHRTPGLREWVTIESVALVPVPANRNGRWSLIALLTLPQQLEDGSPGYLAPWGAVEWLWPEQRVVQIIDLRLHEEVSKLREQKKFISKRPAGENTPLDLITQARRESILYSALDDLLATPPGEHPSLEQLAGLYAGLLPAEIYPYYWILIPSSKEWLKPNVPVSAFTSSQGSTEATSKTDDGSGESGVSKTASEATPMHIEEQSQESIERPRDLSDQGSSWLHSSLRLAESFGIQAVAAELKALDARRKLPGFRLVFVGEIGRGKSTLINRLLDRRILPTGRIPTTAAVTSIVAGSTEQMVVRLPDDRRENRPVAEASWSNLLASDQSNQNIVPQVRLTLDNSWLQELDVEILDTPGVDDLKGQRASLISELLGQCDVAVLLVSASFPFSLTEAAFLEQKVIGQHVPRIIVVVSRLDTLSQEERPKQLKAVSERVSRVSRQVPIVPAHPVDESTTEDKALAIIRSQIKAMVSKADRRAWRSRQIAGAIADHLQQLVEAGRTAIAAAQMSAAKREEAIRQARAEAYSAERQWDQIDLELNQRRLYVDAELRKRLQSAKNYLVEILYFDLSKTSNPKFWWEKDFPFRLNRELVTLAQHSEVFLIDSLARDLKWLQETAEQTFGVKVSKPATDADKPIGITPKIREIPLTDIQRMRLFSRIGSGTATIAGYVFLGPIGSVISAATGIISEFTLSEKVEQQREQLYPEIQRSIDRAVEEYNGLISSRLRKLYEQLAQELKREQDIWLEAKNAALEAGEPAEDQKDWQRLIDEAATLRSDILASLE
jgi:GTPase SAR1 family protein